MKLTPESKKLLSDMFETATGDCLHVEQLYSYWNLAVELGQHEEAENIKETIHSVFPTFYRETWGRYMGKHFDNITPYNAEKEFAHMYGTPNGAGKDRFPGTDEQPEPEEIREADISELTEEQLEHMNAEDIFNHYMGTPKPLNYSAKTAIAEKVEEERARLEEVKARGAEMFGNALQFGKTA